MHMKILAVESEDVTWIQLAHQRIQQLAAVRIAVDLQIPYKVIIYLIKWATVTYWRITAFGVISYTVRNRAWKRNCYKNWENQCRNWRSTIQLADGDGYPIRGRLRCGELEAYSSYTNRKLSLWTKEDWSPCQAVMHIPLGEASNFVARTTQKPLASDTVQESSFVRYCSCFVLLLGTSRRHWMAGIWNEILRPNADKSYLLWTRNKVYELDLVIGLYFPHVSKSLFPRTVDVTTS